ncbi:sulfatase-like hydrolase/transferase [Limimaricola litoreus]|uniref:Sulfatase-like hydrolase/transferase n=1 Tax=Limimaricola litoreus TaxID=2955316 RepID=A0A9X2FY59_9RHOB|nr:sulfatase-like hydrolase/transferase [Limimaricola litoreus]
MSRTPDILVIVSDDQGTWAMAHAGTFELDTPNLDRLAEMGKRFDALYCVSPVCSPARASILTGRIPSAHGVHDWLAAGNSTLERAYHRLLIDYLDGFETYPEILAHAGYRCGLSGKWHLGKTEEPHRGFDFWQAFPTGGGSYRDPKIVDGRRMTDREGYLTEIITDNALEFLRAQDGARPWYLSVHYTAPHSPWALDEHEPEDVAAFWPECDFPSLPRDPMHPDIYDPAAYPETPERRREILSGYAAAIRGMDRQIGRLLDHLEAEGRLEDTFILFTSDNGMNMGHHGIYGKGNGTDPINLFETSVRVPGIAAWPGRIAPGRLTGIYSHYDILPTLLGLANLPDRVPEGLPGRDLSEVLLAEAPEEDGFAVVFDEYGPHRMIRQGRWKYIHRADPEACELYDLETDPGETRNLAALPEQAATRARLTRDLEDWFARYRDPARDGFDRPVRGGGQIDHCTAPRTDLPPYRLHDGRPACPPFRGST